MPYLLLKKEPPSIPQWIHGAHSIEGGGTELVSFLSYASWGPATGSWRGGGWRSAQTLYQRIKGLASACSSHHAGLQTELGFAAPVLPLCSSWEYLICKVKPRPSRAQNYSPLPPATHPVWTEKNSVFPQNSPLMPLPENPGNRFNTLCSPLPPTLRTLQWEDPHPPSFATPQGAPLGSLKSSPCSTSWRLSWSGQGIRGLETC